MYTLNQLTIIGFTGNDAEAHYTPNGTLVVSLSVAAKESWKDRMMKPEARKKALVFASVATVAVGCVVAAMLRGRGQGRER